jgi:hypothetical protein
LSCLSQLEIRFGEKRNFGGPHYVEFGKTVLVISVEGKVTGFGGVRTQGARREFVGVTLPDLAFAMLPI